MSTKIGDDLMSLGMDILTPCETALYGPQAAKVAARSGFTARFADGRGGRNGFESVGKWP